MLRAAVHRLDGILLTHEHRDHVAGIDDLGAINWAMQRPIDLWAEPRTAAAVRRDFGYAFAAERYPGVPDVQFHEVEAGVPFCAAGVEELPIRAMHGRLPILGFRIGPLAYITDAPTSGSSSRTARCWCSAP